MHGICGGTYQSPLRVWIHHGPVHESQVYGGTRLVPCAVVYSVQHHMALIRDALCRGGGGCQGLV